MTTFTASPVSPLRGTPDPSKHVRFTYGMVLDAEDFGQEFAYLSARGEWMVRDLIGYGTVSGLLVTYEPNGTSPRLVVGAGAAVTPKGELVRITRAQCADLNKWLQMPEVSQQATALRSTPTASRLDVYVTLCYRECEVDPLPIPGEPCRSEDEMTAASRVADDFRLDLRLTPPEQPDEQAVRDFVQWLAAIPIIDGASSVSLAQFLQAVRTAAIPIGSPPGSPPDFMYGFPPLNLSIGRGDVCTYIRAAYRLWVTELRPKWNAAWWDAQACACDGPNAAPRPEPCVLLSRATLWLARGLSASDPWTIDSSHVPSVADDDRPFIVPTRMLQEWLWCGCSCGMSASTAATAGGSVVAAGMVTVVSSAAPPAPVGVYGLQVFRPTVVPVGWSAGDFLVRFNTYANPTAASSHHVYIVTATPVVASATANPRIEVAVFDPNGIRLRFKSNTTVSSPINQQFLLEVKQYAR